jgi:hypothetical protein
MLFNKALTPETSTSDPHLVEFFMWCKDYHTCMTSDTGTQMTNTIAQAWFKEYHRRCPESRIKYEAFLTCAVAVIPEVHRLLLPTLLSPQTLATRKRLPARHLQFAGVPKDTPRVVHLHANDRLTGADRLWMASHHPRSPSNAGL